MTDTDRRDVSAAADRGCDLIIIIMKNVVLVPLLQTLVPWQIDNVMWSCAGRGLIFID